MVRFFVNAFVDLLLSPTCPICNELLDRSNSIICPECRFSFDEIAPPICKICGLPLYAENDDVCPSCVLHRPAVHKTRSAFLFGGGVQQAVLTMKLGRRSELAQYLADQASKVSIPDWSWSHQDLLVPVPLSKKRIRSRMFDQASIIALRLGQSIGVPVQLSILQRTKDTPAQASQRSRKKRRLNMKGAFEIIHPELVVGKCICLVDDVITTGATVDECARLILDAGAKKVSAFSLARTPME